MTDVPRRLPPTQEERVRNVVRTRAALSGQGRTSGARPVQQTRPVASVYQAPASGGGVTTGEVDDATSVSISATASGAGSSYARGATSVAIGDNAGADGATSVAIGQYAYTDRPTGAGAIAVGHQAIAGGADTIAIGSYAVTGVESGLPGADRAIAIGKSTVVGSHAAQSTDAIAIGTNACITAGGSAAAARAIAIGVDANVGGDASNAVCAVAIGSGAYAVGDYSLAVGGAGTASDGAGGNYEHGAQADKDGSVAIGVDHTGTPAHATAQDDFVLGTASHHVIVPGALILSDGGTLYRLTVTGGTLGLVAYP